MDSEKATLTMIDNLQKNTGKTLEDWINIVNQQSFTKHNEILNYLKDNFSLTYGFANLVALKALKSDSGSIGDLEELISKQYKGKENFLIVYNKLLEEILEFGNDIDVSPKNNYVSLRRKKQFAILQPATKTRFEIGINLKGQEPKGKLELITSSNSMCSHKINLSNINEIDDEVFYWLKLAYTNAG